MKLEKWAHLAEIVAAGGVILSLLFVGFQVRDGNRETRAATTQAALDAEMTFQAALVRNADVWEKVVMGGELSDKIETRRAIALFNMAMTSEDNSFQMMRSGYIEYSGDTLRRMIALPFFDVWKRSIGASARSTEFHEHIEALRNE